MSNYIDYEAFDLEYLEERRLIEAMFSQPLGEEALKALETSDFKTIYERYKDRLRESVHDSDFNLFVFLGHASFLQDLWAVINDTAYHQWVNIYLENVRKLDEIIRRYKDFDDYGYDLSQSAQDAKNDLYLAQTQPGEPADLDFDAYIDAWIGSDEIKTTAHGTVKAVEIERPLFINSTFNTSFLGSKPRQTVTVDKPVVLDMSKYQSKPTIFYEPEDRWYQDIPAFKPRRPRKRSWFNRIARTQPMPLPEPKSTYRLPEKRADKGEDRPDEYIKIPGNADYERSVDFIHPDFEEALFDDRGISSHALEKGELCELKPREYSHLRFSDIGKMIGRVRSVAYSFKRQNFMLRQNYWQLGVFPDAPKLRYCRDTYMDGKRVTGKWLWQRYGIQNKPEYLDEFGLEYRLKQSMPFAIQNITDKLSQLHRDGVESQDIMLLLLDGVHLDFIADNVKLNGETLSDFIDYAGDEILDFAQGLQDPPGWHESDEGFYYDKIDKINIADCTLYDDSKLELSRAFNEVVLEHIMTGASVKDAYRNAFHHCTMLKSPLGSYAYRLSRFGGSDHKTAMKEFYQIAKSVGDIIERDKIVKVEQDTLIVLTAASSFQKEREITRKIADLKIRNKELFVPAETPLSLKQRIMQFLRPLQLDAKVLATLKE